MLALHMVAPLIIYNTMVIIAVLIFPDLPSLLLTMFGAVLTIPVLMAGYRYDQRRRGKERAVELKFGGCLPYILLLGIGICISVNNIINLTPIPVIFSGFERTAAELYSPPAAVQLLAAGLVIPAVEELIFRGLMFAPLRERMSFWTAAVISSLLFGIYHGNVLQGIYAFILGFTMAWLYERVKTLAAPYLFHVLANVTSILVTNTGLGIISDPDHMTAFIAAMIPAAVLSVFCIDIIRVKTTLKEEEV